MIRLLRRLRARLRRPDLSLEDAYPGVVARVKGAFPWVYPSAAYRRTLGERLQRAARQQRSGASVSPRRSPRQALIGVSALLLAGLALLFWRQRWQQSLPRQRGQAAVGLGL